MSESIEFVFSFRSPYSRIAARHILPMLHPDTEVRWIPFYPLPSFQNFGRTVRAKAWHNLEDILRLAEAYELKIGRPPVDEPDWSLPHTAFLWADRAGKGPEFGQALGEERRGKGEVLGSDETIRRAAALVDLDPDAVVAAGRDENLQKDLAATIQRNFDERDIFGVPMFILPDGKRFWGHDRMEWAIRYGFVRGAENR